MTSTPPTADRALERVMGVRALAASAFNMTVGSGIFVLPAVMASMIGAAAPLAWLICAVAMAFIVLCFAEAGSRVSRTGGAYAYATAAFGPYVGALAGSLLYVGAGVLASASVMNIFARTLGVIAPALGEDVPRAVIMALTYAGLAFLNIRGAKPGVRTMEAFTLGKLIPLLALAVVGVFFIHGGNLAIPVLPPAHDLGRACVVLIFAFLGFENALSPSGEVKDTHRTVPLAVMLALGLVTALYLVVQMVAQGVLGPQLANERAAPLAAVAGIVFGRTGSAIMLVGALLSTFGYLTGDALTTPRALFALAEDGVLPPWLSRVHAVYRTPWLAIGTHACLAFLLAVTGTYEKLIVIANVAILVMYGIIAAGVIAMRWRGIRAEGEPFVLPGGPVIPLAAIAMVIYLVVQSTRAEQMGTWITLALASALYGISLIMRKKYPRPG